jgi:hypothetical protein
MITSLTHLRCHVAGGDVIQHQQLLAALGNVEDLHGAFHIDGEGVTAGGGQSESEISK